MSSDRSSATTGARGGFGKRGAVEISSAPLPQPAAAASGSTANGAKWIGGGLAAVAVVGLLAGTGGGGGGLLGGLLGGLIGSKLANRNAPVAAPAVAPAAAPTSTSSAGTTSVQRGGFGTTGASSSYSSGS